ncbi:MAG: hypothetical protein D6674_06380 [Acidobacteria bacterium]|nr:MAG: hypothetical protein D6674_06380 [Acidobacteriota bacterium]
MSTENPLISLKLLAHHIEEEHGDRLRNLSFPILLTVDLPDGTQANFLINQEGIRFREEVPTVSERMRLSYRDLQRIIEKPSKVVRYVIEGRIRIEGNYRRILETLQSLLLK